VNDIGLDDKILVQELCRARRVRHNASDGRGGEENGIDFLSATHALTSARRNKSSSLRVAVTISQSSRANYG
jgi:hypothetical protein